VLLAFSLSDLGDVALAAFLIVLGVGLFYAFFQLGELFHRLANLVKGAEREVLPVIAKVGGTVDRVNDQLLKVDTMSDSAVDAVESVDRAVRAVSYGVSTPVQKAVGLVTGLKFGAASLRVDRDWRSALAEAKVAAARRERDFVEELGRRGGPGPEAGSGGGSGAAAAPAPPAPPAA
jgi:hypothetical protein